MYEVTGMTRAQSRWSAFAAIAAAVAAIFQGGRIAHELRTPLSSLRRRGLPLGHGGNRAASLNALPFAYVTQKFIRAIDDSTVPTYHCAVSTQPPEHHARPDTQ